MTPEKLHRAKEKLNEAQYNWLYLSVWLGLRPNEIDQLIKDGHLKILRTQEGQSILWIYQTKLASIAPRYRWKLIPLIFSEQKKTVKIIKSGDFERPLVKTVKRYLGSRIMLYGGRKGFTDLMLSRGQNFVDISQWMGHSTIQRTWGSYKSRRIVHY